MLNRNVLYHGQDLPLLQPVPLRAGPLHLLYDQGDLRSIRLGDHEILRRIYVAIRDRNWGTVAPVFSDVDLRVESDRFTIRYAVENRAGEIDFAWQGEIHGEADGAITFQMEGAARSTFWKNRIGFCVLHPALLSGQAALVEHSDGTQEQTRFAVDICAGQPVQPFADLRAVRHEILPGWWAEVQMSGDIFEMEDQRLWTDASYKTFCTPLSLPYPAQIQAGTKIVQSVVLRLLDERPAECQLESEKGVPARARAVNAPEALRLALVEDWKPLPLLGLAVASQEDPLSSREVERLRVLHLHHLRAELCLADAAYPDRLRHTAAQAAALGIPIELALGVTIDSAEEQLADLQRVLEEVHPRVCGWLVFPAREPYAGGNPSEGIARAAWKILKSYDPTIPLAVGTNTDFIFLKRTTPPLDWMDQVCITLNPQVHAFDNQSLIETLEAQPMVIESARRLAKGRPVVVSPITLKPRFNPYATGPQPQTAPGLLPASVDPRQMSLFGGGWTLGSLRAMAAGGAARVTYYETAGWRGVMEWEHGSPLPQVFASLPGSVFPIYHVLADFGEFKGGQAAILASDDGLRVSGLALRKQGQRRYLLANHTAHIQPVWLTGCTGEYQVRSLDETNADTAMQFPEAFRRVAGNRIRATGSGLPLEIQPFGILRLDSI